MKNFLKILIVLVLVINIFILVPNTKSKYVSDNDKIKFEVNQNQCLKIFSPNLEEYPIERRIVAPFDGYYAIIAKGSVGKWCGFGSYKPTRSNSLNNGGIIASYVYLNTNDTLNFFMPGRKNGNGKETGYENLLGVGGGAKANSNGFYGGASTIITLNQQDNKSRENIIIVAAGSGSGPDENEKGGAGGSNIKQRGDANTNTYEFVSSNPGAPGSGTVYFGSKGLGKRSGFPAQVVDGKVMGGEGYKPKGENAGCIAYSYQFGNGGWANGGGGYAGGGGGGGNIGDKGAGAGGTSYMANINGRQKKLPQALYEQITNQYKMSGTKHIEDCDNGCVLFLYLGPDEQTITAFGV